MRNVFKNELNFYSSKLRELFHQKEKFSIENEEVFNVCHTLKGLCLAGGLTSESKLLHDFEEVLLDQDKKKFKELEPQIFFLTEELYAEQEQNESINFFLEEFSNRVSQRLRKKIDLKFEDSTDDFFNFFGPYQFKKLLIHLLINAIDHGIETPRQRNLQNKCAIGSVSIAIKKDKNYFYVSVKDDGQGFEKPKVRSSAFSGRRRGLSIAERLLKTYSGSIEISSECTQGTQVICKVPRVCLKRRELKSA